MWGHGLTSAGWGCRAGGGYFGGGLKPPALSRAAEGEVRGVPVKQDLRCPPDRRSGVASVAGVVPAVMRATGSRAG
jgi:hypothetical protein